MFKWTSSDPRKGFLMPNQKTEEKKEGLNWDGKMEWIMMSKLRRKETGKT
jgi:hypothetical protein